VPEAPPTIGLWEYPRDNDDGLRAAARVALDRLIEPDMDAVMVSARADHVTVQIVRGKLEHPRSILYVEQRGTFEIIRTELWPGARALLVLRAWPSRIP
jgi:hypothetical protein